MTFALYDSAGNLAQTSLAFNIAFEPNVIQNLMIGFNPTIFATDSKVTLNFISNVAYGVGTYFKITTPIDFPKSASVNCQISLTGASPSCSNSAGKLRFTQM